MALDYKIVEKQTKTKRKNNNFVLRKGHIKRLTLQKVKEKKAQQQAVPSHH